jgi:thiamine transport system substrate-binding protein
MLNRALLTAGDPQGDVIFGIDDSVLSRALDGDLLDEYRSPELSTLQPDFSSPDPHVTPVDHGEVCLNYDRGWFAAHRIPPPTSLTDLVRSRYRNLLVVENPATSSPGLAFLLATIATFGDRWETYWRALRANGVLAVVSYASSPAAEVIFASKPLSRAPTAAVEDGCYRQVEYAGVLRGARNEEGAKQLIDFMLSPRFQADVPGSMFVYPVREGVPLPEAFVKHALVPAHPLSLPADEIDANRDRWLAAWTDIVVR